MASAIDCDMMARALRLAAKGRFTATPNPNVGCVIAHGDTVVGEGWHSRAGEPHAEIHALREAGDKARGATAYVTLEPCNHQGRTGPCSEALIEAGIARVVVCCADPNVEAAGGMARLREAGVDVSSGLLEEQGRELHKGFLMRCEQGRPWIITKSAASLDGRTAMASGQSQWITSPEARQDVQRLRAECCAIVTGIGTVLADEPSFTVRLSAEQLGIQGEVRQPLRVVVDSRLQISPSARLLSLPGQTVIACLEDVDQDKIDALENASAEVLQLPALDGHVDIHTLVKALAQRGCNQVLVEAGAGLSGAFVAEGLADELVCYIAPKLFGSEARPLFNLPIQTIDAHLALSLHDMRMVGEDIRLIFRPDRDY